MRCPYCDKEITSTLTYCSHCGQSIKNEREENHESQVDWTRYNELANNKRKSEQERSNKLKEARNRKKRKLIGLVTGTGILLCVGIVMCIAIPKIKYEKANDLFSAGNYEQAAEIYASLGEYGDSEIRIIECFEMQKEQAYQTAVNLLNESEYEGAMNAFIALGDYKDSQEKAVEAKLRLLQNCEAGTILGFGAYEQDNLDNGHETIEWIVLSNNNGELLLLSKYIIDAQNYIKANNESDWEHNSIRAWLNEIFLFEAFSGQERSAIMQVLNPNPHNEKYGTLGGDDTIDNVFLLSIDEVNAYLQTDDARVTEWTEYANSRYDDLVVSPAGGWMLRSPGKHANQPVYVEQYGNIYEDANWLGDEITVGIRPVIWVDIEYIAEFAVLFES